MARRREGKGADIMKRDGAKSTNRLTVARSGARGFSCASEDSRTLRLTTHCSGNTFDESGPRRDRFSYLQSRDSRLSLLASDGTAVGAVPGRLLMLEVADE